LFSVDSAADLAATIKIQSMRGDLMCINDAPSGSRQSAGFGYPKYGRALRSYWYVDADGTFPDHIALIGDPRIFGCELELQVSGGRVVDGNSGDTIFDSKINYHDNCVDVSFFYTDKIIKYIMQDAGGEG